MHANINIYSIYYLDRWTCKFLKSLILFLLSIFFGLKIKMSSVIIRSERERQSTRLSLRKSPLVDSPLWPVESRRAVVCTFSSVGPSRNERRYTVGWWAKQMKEQEGAIAGEKKARRDRGGRGGSGSFQGRGNIHARTRALFNWPGRYAPYP